MSVHLWRVQQYVDGGWHDAIDADYRDVWQARQHMLTVRQASPQVQLRVWCALCGEARG
jgi:hypothetical protein